MIIADSDILIDYLGSRDPGASQVQTLIEAGEICTTAVNRYEVMSGVGTRRQIERTRRLFTDIPTLILDSESADRAAQLRRGLESKGLAIGMADSLVAGIALTINWALLTRNRRHFERVEGLILAPLG
jgi:tRNA(fMet)-specific endonuclease VapC